MRSTPRRVLVLACLVLESYARLVLARLVPAAVVAGACSAPRLAAVGAVKIGSRSLKIHGL